MTYSPKVTTILALVAEQNAIHNEFKELPNKDKLEFLLALGVECFKHFNIKEDQREEFAKRYIDEIVIPWCYFGGEDE